MSPGDIARSLMNTPRQCFGHHVACGNYCQADKLSNPAEHRFKNFPRGKPLQARSIQQFLGELFSPYVDVIPLRMLYNIYRSVITCTWIYLDLCEMWGVEVMTKTRCRVGTVPAIAAGTRLVTSTHTHPCHLN